MLSPQAWAKLASAVATKEATDEDSSDVSPSSAGGSVPKLNCSGTPAPGNADPHIAMNVLRRVEKSQDIFTALPGVAGKHPPGFRQRPRWPYCRKAKQRCRISGNFK
jgi:hypothetical protein